MTGERQQVREAVAGYFGGVRIAGDAGVCFQGGPLTPAGLGTAYPYAVKGVPDPYYFAGKAAGAGWGAIMAVSTFERTRQRRSLGGWFDHWYNVTCDLAVISQEPHIETAEAGLDDLIDGMLTLLYADPTLGTTTPDGMLIEMAGENPFGQAASGLAGRDQTAAFQPVVNSEGRPDARGRYFGEATFQFWVFLSVLRPVSAVYP